MEAVTADKKKITTVYYETTVYSSGEAFEILEAQNFEGDNVTTEVASYAYGLHLIVYDGKQVVGRFRRWVGVVVTP